MATTHKLRTVIEHGDPDRGAEIECEITFRYRKGSSDYYNKAGGHWEQGWVPASDFISAIPLCNGEPSPFHGAYADLEQRWLNDMAEVWLDTDDGQTAAFEAVCDDDDHAREYAAELRRE